MKNKITLLVLYFIPIIAFGLLYLKLQSMYGARFGEDDSSLVLLLPLYLGVLSAIPGVIFAFWNIKSIEVFKTARNIGFFLALISIFIAVFLK